MSVIDSVEIDGRKFYVGSGLETRQDIVVPVSSLEGLTDAEIGAILRKLIPLTRKMDVLYFCDWILHSGILPASRMDIGVANSILEEAAPHLPDLIKFQDEDETIKEVLEIVESCKSYAKTHELAARTKRQKRGKISGSYERLLVQLGRRDGFKCAVCGSSEADLQIDHIKPVSRNGDNELTNLQLLCRSCNIKKGNHYEE